MASHIHPTVASPNAINLRGMCHSILTPRHYCYPCQKIETLLSFFHPDGDLLVFIPEGRKKGRGKTKLSNRPTHALWMSQRNLNRVIPDSEDIVGIIQRDTAPSTCLVWESRVGRTMGLVIKLRFSDALLAPSMSRLDRAGPFVILAPYIFHCMDGSRGHSTDGKTGLWGWCWYTSLFHPISGRARQEDSLKHFPNNERKLILCPHGSRALSERANCDFGFLKFFPP